MTPVWTRCGNGACIEAALVGMVVLVRESVDPDRMQAWTHREWESFTHMIELGWTVPFVWYQAAGGVRIGPERFAYDEQIVASDESWSGFCKRVLEGEFSLAALRKSASSAVLGCDAEEEGAVADWASVSATAATGECGDPAPPAPVAALDSPSGRSSSAHPEADAIATAGRLGEVADDRASTPGPVSVPSSLMWVEDASLGEPQGPSAGPRPRLSVSPTGRLDHVSTGDVADAVVGRSGPETAVGADDLPGRAPAAPRTWGLPPQPGREVRAVRDGDGELWVRRFEAGEFELDDIWRCGDRVTLSWSMLLEELGPLTDASAEVPAVEVGDDVTAEAWARAIAPLVPPVDGAS